MFSSSKSLKRLQEQVRQQHQQPHYGCRFFFTPKRSINTAHPQQFQSSLQLSKHRLVPPALPLEASSSRIIISTPETIIVTATPTTSTTKITPKEVTAPVESCTHHVPIDTNIININENKSSSDEALPKQQEEQDRASLWASHLALLNDLGIASSNDQDVICHIPISDKPADESVDNKNEVSIENNNHEELPKQKEEPEQEQEQSSLWASHLALLSDLGIASGNRDQEIFINDNSDTTIRISDNKKPSCEVGQNHRHLSATTTEQQQQQQQHDTSIKQASSRYHHLHHRFHSNKNTNNKNNNDEHAQYIHSNPHCWKQRADSAASPLNSPFLKFTSSSSSSSSSLSMTSNLPSNKIIPNNNSSSTTPPSPPVDEFGFSKSFMKQKNYHQQFSSSSKTNKTKTKLNEKKLIKMKSLPSSSRVDKTKQQGCTRCGRPNHTAARCNAKTTIAYDLCHLCGEDSHWMKDCPERKRMLREYFLQQKKQQQQQQDRNENDENNHDNHDHNSAAAAEKATQGLLSSPTLTSKQITAITKVKWSIQNNSGVYVLVSSESPGFRYVGTSINIYRRIRQHFTGEGGANFTKHLSRLRRVRPIPLVDVTFDNSNEVGRKLTTSGTTSSLAPFSSNNHRNCFLQTTNDKLHSTTTTSGSTTSSSPSKICLSTHQYCEETRQTLAQMRAFGVDKVRGAAFCRLQHTNSDYLCLSKMFKHEDRRVRKQLNRNYNLWMNKKNNETNTMTMIFADDDAISPLYPFNQKMNNKLLGKDFSDTLLNYKLSIGECPGISLTTSSTTSTLKLSLPSSAEINKNDEQSSSSRSSKKSDQTTHDPADTVMRTISNTTAPIDDAEDNKKKQEIDQAKPQQQKLLNKEINSIPDGKNGKQHPLDALDEYNAGLLQRKIEREKEKIRARKMMIERNKLIHRHQLWQEDQNRRQQRGQKARGVMMNKTLSKRNAKQASSPAFLLVSSGGGAKHEMNRKLSGGKIMSSQNHRKLF